MASLDSDDLRVQVTHTAGSTRVLYLPQGAPVEYALFYLTHRRLVTAGEDHLVRILPAEATASDVNPIVIEDATRPMTWIDADAEYLVTASEDGAVRLYKQGSAELIQIIRREVLPVRCVAIESASRHGALPRTAVCSDELIVRVVNAADPRSIVLLTGHSRGVRAASWSPALPLLFTAGSDGDVRAWDMSETEPRCVKVLQNMLPALRPESEFSSSVVWHPSGAIFAMPLRTQEIALVRAPISAAEMNGEHVWETVVIFGSASGTTSAEQKVPSGLVSALAFCPNGRYLAAATEDMQVTVWARDSRRVLRVQQAEALVTGLSWHPTQDTLAWTDAQGQLVRWESVIGTTLPSPFEQLQFAHAQAEPDVPAEELEEDLDDLFDDTPIDEPATHKPVARRRPAPRADVNVLTQPSFQPGSTPMEAQRRYLSVTTFGTLTAVDQDTHQTISFESYDTSQRRNFRFTDHYGYKMASVAPQGILFACEAESENPSTIFYRPFDDVPGIQTEWSINLAPNENAVAIALGGVVNAGSYADVHVGSTTMVDEGKTSAATAVVATSQGYLRFLGMSGMQRYVWSLGLPVVTLAASATAVLVVYRAANVSPNHVHLEYMLIDLTQLATLQHGPLPLVPEATLTWAGFNELGAPAVFDSMGTLYVLDRAWRPGQARWVPALDTTHALLPARASAAEESESRVPRVRCWPISVTATHLLGLLLPMTRTYPQVTTARPVVQELAMAMCVTQRENAATPLEEAALRSSLLANATRDARAATGDETLRASRLPVEQSDPSALEIEADKALLQLVQLACKADRYARALDGTRALHSEATLDAALKIASFFHLPSLADRLELVRAPLAVRKELEEETTDRACGVDALLRNTARLPVPVAEQATGTTAPTPSSQRLQESFLPRRPSETHGRSALAQEGIAQKQAMDSSQTAPSSSAMTTQTPSSTNDTLPTPAPPTRSNPFARTQSVARERQLQKNPTGYDRNYAPQKRKAPETEGNGSDKRASGKQATLAKFAYMPSSNASAEDFAMPSSDEETES